MYQKMQDIPPEYMLFLNDLLDEKGIRITDSSLRGDMLVELASRFDAFFTLRLLEKLSDSDKDVFMQMTQKQADQKTVRDFITEKIPNSENEIKDLFVEFKLLYLQK